MLLGLSSTKRSKQEKVENFIRNDLFFDVICVFDMQDRRVGSHRKPEKEQNFANCDSKLCISGSLWVASIQM